MKVNLEIQVEQADAALMEFSTEPSESQIACDVEMTVVKNRLEAARVVLSVGSSADDSKAAMDKFLAKFGRGLRTSDAGSTVGQAPKNTQDPLARCGPCPGFQNLKAIPWIVGQANKLKDTSSSDSSSFKLSLIHI